MARRVDGFGLKCLRCGSWETNFHADAENNSLILHCLICAQSKAVPFTGEPKTTLQERNKLKRKDELN